MEIVFNIETAGLPKDEILHLMPEFSAPSNYKDAEKIQAYKAKKQEEWLLDASGSALSGKVLAIALQEPCKDVAFFADDSDNLKLVLCGHSGRPARMSGNIDYTNAKGRRIPLVLFNPQSCGGWHGNGGDGWLRIMEFMPDGKTVSMRTYSPLFAASERTQDLSWNRDSDNEFRLVLE